MSILELRAVLNRHNPKADPLPERCAHLGSPPACKDHRGVDLISDALPFDRLWYGEPNAITNAIGYAKFYSRSHDAVIRVYDETWQRDRNARARRRFPQVLKPS
jgi:hypothetical protein